MQEVAERYGYQPDTKGFISCPFHTGDKTPSLKLYPEDKGWYCFGCHAGRRCYQLCRPPLQPFPI